MVGGVMSCAAPALSHEGDVRGGEGWNDGALGALRRIAAGHGRWRGRWRMCEGVRYEPRLNACRADDVRDVVASLLSLVPCWVWLARVECDWMSATSQQTLRHGDGRRHVQRRQRSKPLHPG